MTTPLSFYPCKIFSSPKCMWVYAHGEVGVLTAEIIFKIKKIEIKNYFENCLFLFFFCFCNMPKWKVEGDITKFI